MKILTFFYILLGISILSMLLINFLLSIGNKKEGTKYDNEDYGVLADLSFVIVGGCIVIFAIFVLLFIFINTAAFVDNGNERYYRDLERVELISLGDTTRINGKISGGFLSVRGSINENGYYVYYRKEGEKITQGRINTDRGYIYEDEESQPYAIRKELIIKANKKIHDRWSWLVEIEDEQVVHDIIDFHIPKGSVIEQYNLDLN